MLTVTLLWYWFGQSFLWLFCWLPQLLKPINYALILLCLNITWGHKLLHRQNPSNSQSFEGLFLEGSVGNLSWPQGNSSLRSPSLFFGQTSQPTVELLGPVILPVSFQLLFTTSSLLRTPLGFNFSTFYRKWSHFPWGNIRLYLPCDLVSPPAASGSGWRQRSTSLWVMSPQAALSTQGRGVGRRLRSPWLVSPGTAHCLSNSQWQSERERLGGAEPKAELLPHHWDLGEKGTHTYYSK